ncbi:MAG: hypothetical protein LUC94_00980 [Clostridiales bacterium]|nr:hypothetical protein [Clostridiales bacterium]
MPRGRVKLTPQEKIDKINTQIADYTAKIEELKAEAASIQKLLDEQAVADVIKIMQEKGLTPDDIKKIIEEHEKEEIAEETEAAE